jgi:hypothetical protein
VVEVLVAGQDFTISKAQPMPTIEYDSTSGNLRKNLVWNLGIESSIAGADMWCNWFYGKDEWVHGCPANPKHETNVRCIRLEIELYGQKDKHVPYYIPMANHGFTIISDAFAKLLKQSGLKGFVIRDIVKIVVNETHQPDPKLYLWEITGKGGFVKRNKVIGEPVTCPFCHKEPMVCKGCGRVNDPCFLCHKRTLIMPDETPKPNEKRVYYHWRTGPKIVEAKDWDGSDWFSVKGEHDDGPFVNRRAKAWCEKIGAPFLTFEPALLNVAGVEDRFK